MTQPQNHPRPTFAWFLLLCLVAGLNFFVVPTILLDTNSVSDKGRQLSREFQSGSRNGTLQKSTPQASEGRLRVATNRKEEFERIRTSFEETSMPEDGSAIVSLTTKRNKEIENDTVENTVSDIPYYLKGKTKYKGRKFHRKKTFQWIDQEIAAPVKETQKVWVLPDPVKLPTRNHESILLEYDNKQILVNVLGRYSRGVQWMDLLSGEQWSVETTGRDPDDRPLNDLNHVASVVVDSLGNHTDRIRKEVWLPCGFHNDRIGNELSSNYVRIVDLETMNVRTGPKLPFSGGACGAAPIEAIPGEPPLICAFGGTNGNHDTGIFLPYISCYDRIAEKWVYPFGKLPVGMDHLSVVVIPKATCHPEDPARVLVFNFRTKNYATHTAAEILAFDIPTNGWTRKQLEERTANDEGMWYTFANHSFTGGEDEAYAPRDASGVVLANGGRSVVNFGGINQIPNPKWKKKDRSFGPKVFSTWYSTVRELNVCGKTWEKVADLGIQTFALMASASTTLNTAFFCGGSMYRQDYNGNTNLCLAVRIPGMHFWNHRTAAVENFPPGFQAGGKTAVKAAGASAPKLIEIRATK